MIVMFATLVKYSLGQIIMISSYAHYMFSGVCDVCFPIIYFNNNNAMVTYDDNKCLRYWFGSLEFNGITIRGIMKSDGIIYNLMIYQKCELRVYYHHSVYIA